MEPSYDIIDIGVNLAHRSFSTDRKQVIERAFSSGVRTMIITGTNLASSEAALQIAREYPDQLFTTAGVHRLCEATSHSALQLEAKVVVREVLASDVRRIEAYIRWRVNTSGAANCFEKDFRAARRIVAAIRPEVPTRTLESFN